MENVTRVDETDTVKSSCDSRKCNNQDYWNVSENSVPLRWHTKYKDKTSVGSDHAIVHAPKKKTTASLDSDTIICEKRARRKFHSVPSEETSGYSTNTAEKRSKSDGMIMENILLKSQLVLNRDSDNSSDTLDNLHEQTPTIRSLDTATLEKRRTRRSRRSVSDTGEGDQSTCRTLDRERKKSTSSGCLNPSYSMDSCLNDIDILEDSLVKAIRKSSEATRTAMSSVNSASPQRNRNPENYIQNVRETDKLSERTGNLKVNNANRPLRQSMNSLASSVASKKTSQSRDTRTTSLTQQSKAASNCTRRTSGDTLYTSYTINIDSALFLSPCERCRKCMGPIIVILLVLILAASFAAAIYFAASLNKAQEKQIDFLQATLAMKIRGTSDASDITNLTPEAQTALFLSYCQEMDIYYKQSPLKQTYRGCQVNSITSKYINFTLFFAEEKATEKDIFSVIESSATRLHNGSSPNTTDNALAEVGKLKVHLDDVKINVNVKQEVESFNKMSNVDIVTTQPTPVYNREPCLNFKGDEKFPHPDDCSLLFHCVDENQSLLKCMGGFVFHWRKKHCVPWSADVHCPTTTTPTARTNTTTTTDPTTSMTTTTTTTPGIQELRTTMATETSSSSVVSSTTTSSMDIPTEATITFISTTDVEPIKSTYTVVKRDSTTVTMYSTTINLEDYTRRVYPENPCQNKSAIEFHPHPDHCNLYIHCDNGKGKVRSCAEGLVYFPEDTACNFPPNDMYCPDLTPCETRPNGYFPHPYNCTAYIQCDHGNEIIRECTEGKIWDVESVTCNVPERVMVSVCKATRKTIQKTIV